MQGAAFTDTGVTALDSPEPEARLWRVAIRPAPAPAETAILSADEAAQGGRFRHAADGARFLQTRAALRRILAGATGRAPERLAFSVTAQGKPVLADAGPHFNVAHSGAFALIGLAARPVGVDIEQTCATVDIPGMARQFFSPDEQRRLARLDEAARRDAFYQIWTVKEAVLKALGLGLGGGLGDFSVSFRPDGAVDLRPAPRWAMRFSTIRAHSVAAPPGYAAACAVA